MLMSFEDLQTDSRVSKHTWRLWVKQGKVPSVRLGRRVLVEEEAYRKFIASSRVPARPEAAGR